MESTAVNGVELLTWQRIAVREVGLCEGQATVCACPGAGKSIFAAHLAAQALKSGYVEKILIAVPSYSLKPQWAMKTFLENFGLDISIKWKPTDGAIPSEYDGAVICFQSLLTAGAAKAVAMEAKRCFVIIDEVHRLGDDDVHLWGAKAKKAFETSDFRLLLTGTMFRGDKRPIALVEYEDDEDCTVKVDVKYTYREALKDRVCSRAVFHSCPGTAKWIRDNGEGVQEASTEDDDLDYKRKSRLLNSLLDPRHGFVDLMLSDADRKLTEIQHKYPKSRGIVICRRVKDANAIARKLPNAIVITSEEDDVKDKIKAFDKGVGGRWIVTVDMVAEGTDLPNAKVMVYATNKTSMRYVRQAWFRVLRGTQPGHIFLPRHHILDELAREIEEDCIAELGDEPEKRDPKEDDGNSDPVITTTIGTEKTGEYIVESGREYDGGTYSAIENFKAELCITAPTSDVYEAAKKILPLMNFSQTITAPMQPCSDVELKDDRKDRLKTQIQDVMRKLAVRRTDLFPRQENGKPDWEAPHATWKFNNGTPTTEDDYERKLAWGEKLLAKLD